jgi:ABC-type Zn2+ transport system substrate-binding protein/surface adhesin
MTANFKQASRYRYQVCRRAAFAEATACQARLPLQALSRVKGCASRGGESGVDHEHDHEHEHEHEHEHKEENL